MMICYTYTYVLNPLFLYDTYVLNPPFFQVFEGHGHYVMMVKINPRDTNTFATASLDKTIKVCYMLYVMCVGVLVWGYGALVDSVHLHPLIVSNHIIYHISYIIY
jgi:WD40 repeat protein